MRRNPDWIMDGHTVEVEERPKGWYYDLHGHEHGPFDTHDDAVKDAARVIGKLAAPIGTIGDVDPIEHDGGIIYRKGEPPSYYMVYFQGYGDERVSVYNVPIPMRMNLLDIVEVDMDEMATSPEHRKRLERWAKSSDPVDRASFYEEIGHYRGFMELDHQPEDMPRETAEAMWGKDLRRMRGLPEKVANLKRRLLR